MYNKQCKLLVNKVRSTYNHCVDCRCIMVPVCIVFVQPPCIDCTYSPCVLTVHKSLCAYSPGVLCVPMYSPCVSTSCVQPPFGLSSCSTHPTECCRYTPLRVECQRLTSPMNLMRWWSRMAAGTRHCLPVITTKLHKPNTYNA